VTRQQMRASQLITTFGPGSMVDLPKDSVIIGGLEDWRHDRLLAAAFEIDEPRLLEKVRAQLGVADLRLRTPPAKSDAPSRAFSPEVGVWRFPLWFTLRTVSMAGRFRRRRLVHARFLRDGKFEDEQGKKHDVVPVRFVRACRRGHVDDIDWPYFVHQAHTECVRAKHLEERGTSGDLGDIYVVCECGASQPLYQAAFREMKVLGACSGQRPWLGHRAREDCSENSRLLVRNASNAYFAVTQSVISIPPRGAQLDEFVGANLNTLVDAVALPSLIATLRKVPPFTDGLRGYDDAEVLAAVKRVMHTGPSGVGIKDAEFEALSAAQAELGSDMPHGNFYARALPLPKNVSASIHGVERVVLVHRLREVLALVGFTRFESSSPDIQGELDQAVTLAPLARDLSTVKWIPAVENRGEGIFLEFDPAAIHAWCEKPAVKARSDELRAGYARWAEEHKVKGEHIGMPYVLLHSIAHLLLTSLSLECGYPSSSLRERIYALPSPDGKSGQYGILVYTGSSDAEGTLGGLIEAGRSIERHMRNALETALLCSNDPVCAAHSPSAHGHSPLLGAACHGCLLISETSCERRNDYLDRAVVVPTVEAQGCEFFESAG
jgi:hypothetical protein